MAFLADNGQPEPYFIAGTEQIPLDGQYLISMI
jgi:hypothetical protein